MKQENFLFVDVVSSIFLLILMMGNFMGLLYITSGNYAISLLISLFIVVCYYFIIQVLKKNKEIMVNKKYATPASLFFIVFLVFGFVSFILMTHTLNIELNFKKKIQEEADQKIEKVKQLSEVYNNRANDDLLNYEGNLTQKLNTYKASKSNVLRNELSLEPYKIDDQILAAPAFIDATTLVDSKLQPFKLKVENNKKNIDKTIVKAADSYKQGFDNWDRLSLMKDYKGLNEYVQKSYDFVNAKITELPLDKEPLVLNMSKKQLPLNNPLELNKMYKPDFMIPALVILFIHLFILIPFFTYKVRKGGGALKEKKVGKIEGGHSI